MVKTYCPLPGVEILAASKVVVPEGSTKKTQASSPLFFLEILFYDSYIMCTLNMFVCILNSLLVFV